MLSALVSLLLGVGSVGAVQDVRAGSLATVPGREACVVGLEDGRLLALGLASGEVRAEARAAEPDTPAHVLRSTGDVLVTWAGWYGGRVVLRSWDDLSERDAFELGPDRRLVATSPDGRRAVGAPSAGDPWVLVGVGLEPVELGTGVRAAAFEPEGSRLVVIGAERGELRDAASGRVLGGFPLSVPEAARTLRLEPAQVSTPLVAFLGADRLVVPWSFDVGDDEATGFQVLALPGGELLAEVESPVDFDHHVDRLAVDAGLGRVVLSLQSSGYVHVYREEDWTPIWSVDYGGGNPSGMRLERGGHPRWVGVSGMQERNSRVVDLASGEEVVPRALVAGLFHLTPTDSGRALVGLRDGGVSAVDVEAGAVRFVRFERAEGPPGIRRGAAFGRGG